MFSETKAWIISDEKHNVNERHLGMDLTFKKVLVFYLVHVYKVIRAEAMSVLLTSSIYQAQNV